MRCCAMKFCFTWCVMLFYVVFLRSVLFYNMICFAISYIVRWLIWLMLSNVVLWWYNKIMLFDVVLWHSFMMCYLIFDIVLWWDIVCVMLNMNINMNTNMNMNGIYHFKVYVELLYFELEAVTVRKKNMLGGALLALSVMISPGSSCYWKMIRVSLVSSGYVFYKGIFVHSPPRVV